MVLSNLTGTINDTFVPVSGEQFRHLPKDGPAEPISTVVLLTPNAEGRFVEIGGTWKHVPTWLALVEIVVAVWFLLAVLSIVLYAPFWIFGGLLKKRRRPAERPMRLWPLIAVLSLLASIGLFALAQTDVLARLGNPTVWSFGLMLTTLTFGIASLASTVALWVARKREIRRGGRWFSIAVTGCTADCHHVLCLLGSYWRPYLGLTSCSLRRRSSFRTSGSCKVRCSVSSCRDAD
jgi:hypothetical protein